MNYEAALTRIRSLDHSTEFIDLDDTVLLRTDGVDTEVGPTIGELIDAICA